MKHQQPKSITLPSTPPPLPPAANPADQLSRDMTAARESEFPGDQPAEVFPSLFFDYSDKNIDPIGGQTPRGPKLCATLYGATRVAAVLGATSIVMGNPAIFTGLNGSFSDTLLVPWLIFTKGTVQSPPINAGLLLDYFNHGAPWSTALASAQAEVEAAFA